MKNSRREFMRTVGAAGGALLPSWPAGAAAKRPNIIFLLTDDQAYNAMGRMGNDEIKTPNMDRLSSDGVTFDKHYDTTAICMASRAQIMTGMYEYKTGCNFEHGSLSAGKFQKSYPKLMQQAGYRTGFAGKFGFAVTPEMSSNDAHGSYDKLPVDEFDWWRGWTGQGSYDTARNKYMVRYAKQYPHVSRALGAAGQEFIRQSAGADQPFCLSISFKAPHKPPVPDPAFSHVYDGVTFTKPPNYGAKGMEHLPSQALSGRQFLQRTEWYPEETYQKRLRLYYEQIYGVDVAIGMLRDELEKQGLADNTAIIHTSDNGYFCGSHFFQGKVLPYEEGSRAPLIIYDPRHNSAGKRYRVKGVTGNIDLAPTMLELAGVDAPANMDGTSLLPMLNDPKTNVRESLFLIQVWPFSEKCQALSVVTNNYKYIYWFYGDAYMEPAEEVYDLREDPYELNNVAGRPEHKAALESLRAYYDKHHRHWKENCVPGNGYPEYIKMADRRIAWKDKEFKLK